MDSRLKVKGLSELKILNFVLLLYNLVLFQNLSTIYLKIAFGRLSSQEKIELLPSILERLVDKVENKSACNE